jgi:GNAT superfamily N-acetyltransferase
MTVRVRPGAAADIERAVDVYVRSNLARRHGPWPNQAARTEFVSRRLADPEGWFFLAGVGDEAVGMVAVVPLLGDDGGGDPIPGGWFVSLIFVVPERWGEGIGGALLDAALEEAAHRGGTEVRLWTDEDDNERAHRLYRSRGFEPTGRTVDSDERERAGEWIRRLRDQTGLGR